MTFPQTRFCFCTLALGGNYRALAMELAKDIETYSPNTQFIIFTDQPNYFQGQKNVLAVDHKLKSVSILFDKVFVLEKALSMYEHCIFVDADVRILSSVPEDLSFPSGITAHSCFSIYKLYDDVFKKHKNKPSTSKHWTVLKTVAEKLDINLDEVKFIWEYLFYVTRDEKTQEFLELTWTIGRYYEQHGRYGGEGEAMGLAAAKLGIPVNYDYDKKIDFFKDRVELYKISKGLADPERSKPYLEKQKSLEHPQRSFLKKVSRKLKTKLGKYNRLWQLKIANLSDFDFYYR